MSWWNPFAAVVKPIASVAKSVIDGKTRKAELTAAAHQRKMEMIQCRDTNNANWEITALVSSGIGLKWASFGLFTIPIILTIVLPLIGMEAIVDKMWNSFGLVPEGWMQVYFIITGSIWGVAMLKDLAPELIKSFRKSGGNNVSS